MVGSPMKKDKTRIIKAYIVFRTSADLSSDPSHDHEDGQQNRILTLQKIISKKSSSSNNKNDDDDEIDENAVALLSLPDGYQTYCSKRNSSSSTAAAFHTFLITRQNGSRLYGSAMLVRDEDEECITAHCLITTIPFVVAARHLLTYFVHRRVDTNLIARICNLKVPSKGKCLKLLLPGYDKDVIVFRGSASYPLLDYPLRELLTKVLSPENVSMALIAAMLEFQIVILAKDYYQLMLVSESLTSLLLPFSWQHVYVPILPARLGLNYLDAPTPYIMGLNVNVFSPSLLSSSLSSLSSHSVQCRIFCEEDRIEFVASDKEESDILNMMPAFQSQLSQEIDLILRTDVKLTTSSRKRSKHSLKPGVVVANNKHHHNTDDDASFSYLDDLKLNQLIRMTCMTCLNESLLHDIEKFIIPRGNVNNHNNGNNNRTASSTTKCFDHVSYLSQQADKNLPFLKKFIETQMFASVIDQKYKMLMRRKSSTASLPEQDTLLLKTSAPIDSLHTVDEFLGEVFQGAFDDATIVNLNEPDIAKSCSSPLRQRKVIDLGSRDHFKALPDLRGSNSLDQVTQQLESLKHHAKSQQKQKQQPNSSEAQSFAKLQANDKIPSETDSSPCVVPLPAKVMPDESPKHQNMRDEEREMRAMAALNAHLKVCEAEKEKLRGQIHRLCQENVTLRDELADSQVRLKASSKYTKQLEDDKRHLEFLLSMKKYDDFKSVMDDPYERKASFIESIPMETNNRSPAVNNNLNHQVIRLNPKSPVLVHQSQASVSNSTPVAGVPETPTKLKGFQSRMLQYYNKVLTRIND
jgi:hypothetical protein